MRTRSPGFTSLLLPLRRMTDVRRRRVALQLRDAELGSAVDVAALTRVAPPLPQKRAAHGIAPDAAWPAVVRLFNHLASLQREFDSARQQWRRLQRDDAGCCERRQPRHLWFALLRLRDALRRRAVPFVCRRTAVMRLAGARSRSLQSCHGFPRSWCTGARRRAFCAATTARIVSPGASQGLAPCSAPWLQSVVAATRARATL